MANTLKTPKVMPSEFCAYGDKNTILTNPSTSNPQLANFSTGFPAITQNPIPNGGIPPERADFNGMFNLLSSALVYIQNGGQWTFVPEVSNAIGGYPAGAILNYYDATHKVNKRVISNINNNVNNFLLDPSQIGDSSKPWSYTESTPIVQNLDNPSTDTVPSTQAVSKKIKAINASLNDKASLSKTNSFSGLNIFNAATDFYGSVNMQNGANFRNTNYFYESLQTFNNGYEIMRNTTTVGNNTQVSMVFGNSIDTKTGNVYTNLASRKVVNGKELYSVIQPVVTADGKLYITAPGSAVSNSVVTTVLSGTNFVRLGNGLIIQWGTVVTGDGGSTPVVLPTAFSNTNYQVVFGHNNLSAGGIDFYGAQIVYTTKTATGFTTYCRNSGSYHNSEVTWLAIGR